jgi:hypothetical protein
MGPKSRVFSNLGGGSNKGAKRAKIVDDKIGLKINKSMF